MRCEQAEYDGVLSGRLKGWRWRARCCCRAWYLFLFTMHQQTETVLQLGEGLCEEAESARKSAAGFQ